MTRIDWREAVLWRVHADHRSVHSLSYFITDNSSNRTLHKAKFRIAKTDWRYRLMSDAYASRCQVSTPSPHYALRIKAVSPRHKPAPKMENSKWSVPAVPTCSRCLPEV